MPHSSLFESCLISLIATPADSTPTSATESNYRVDMLGWDNVDFICTVGALTDAPTFAVVESTTSSGGSVSAVAGATSAEIADTSGDESIVILSVARSSLTKRYVTVTAIFDADGSSASIWCVHAVRYNGNGQTFPVTQVAADLAGAGYKTIELVKA